MLKFFIIWLRAVLLALYEYQPPKILSDILPTLALRKANTLFSLFKYGIKYLPNNFQILENGDHVICAISGKPIKLDELKYWNVDLQEPYYSYVEASKKREKN